MAAVLVRRPEDRPQSSLWFMVAVMAMLLFAGWLRTQHLVDFYEWPDEIWSLWHVQGTFAEAMARVPFDWPPLFSMVAWVWTQLAGHALEASRYLMILFALLAVVFTYRAAGSFLEMAAPQASGKGRAKWVAMACAITFGYLVFSGVEVRAYGLVLMFGALSFWMTLRWMRQPSSWKRMLLLAAALALMFYSTFTSVLFIGFLSLMVLVIQPRSIVRWMMVGVATAVIALPAVIQFVVNAAKRLDVMEQPPKDFLTEMARIYTAYGGTPAQAAVMGGALVLVLVLAGRRLIDWRWGLLLTAWVAIPAGIYVVLPNREYLNVRYVWWVALGLVVLVATATLYLPRMGQWATIAVLVGMTFLPVDWLQFRVGATEAVPMRMVLSWFASQIRPGDVLIKDPYCICGAPIAWDYFLPQYFPQGDLPWVDAPGDHPRVWYLATTGWTQDEALKADIMQGRRESIFVGPWNFLLRLYEGPPLWEGIGYEDTLALNGFEIADNRTTFREDDTINVKLWWSALRQPPLDYSISLSLFDEAGNLVTQSDSPAQAPDTPQQTSAWAVGAYYEDYRTLRLPKGLPGRDYQLMVTVYDWQTGERLKPAVNDSFTLAGPNGDYLLLKTISVVSY